LLKLVGKRAQPTAAETAKMMADAELVNAAVMAELEAELKLAEAEDDEADEK